MTLILDGCGYGELVSDFSPSSSDQDILGIVSRN